MTFKLPSPFFYLSTLIISALLAALAFWVLRSQGLDTNGLIVLGTGLFIGHLIGVCFHASAHTSTARKPAAASRKSTDSANSAPSTNGDTISLYVGNLAYSAQRTALHDLFAEYGPVNSVRIMTDRNTRRPRGYGFVDMEKNAGLKAMAALDNTDFCGRSLKVNEAQQRD